MDIDKILKQFESDKQAYFNIFSSFDEKEDFLKNKIIDSGKGILKSQVLDQTLMTSLIRRANQVMAKMPTGVVRVLSKEDKGKGVFLNLILDHYIIPNANSQADIYTKFWLMEFLSLVYGKMDVLVDWVVKEGYTGPDFFLIPPKLGIPEPGVISTNDMSRYFVLSYVAEDFLKKRKGLKYWKNIDKVIEKGKKNKTDERDTSTTKEREDSDLYKDQYELITLYTPKRWITFSRQARVILRDIENPHQNGKLPIVSKVCYPTLDNYFGTSEYDRNISQQKALNSTVNLSLDALKKHLYPPTKIYPTDVHMPSFSLSPGAVWVLKNPNPNAITQEQFSPAPLQTFNSLYGVLKGALLSSLGTTDTTVSSSVEPAQGKTPEALKMQQMFITLNTSFDRKMLEQAISEIYDRFLDLLTHKQEADIEFDIFGDEFNMIKEQYPDILDLYESGEGGKIKIKNKDIKNLSVKFFIDASSTMKQDEMIENQNLTSILGFFLKLPGFMEQVAQQGKAKYGSVEIDFSELLKRFIATAGVEGYDKIIKEAPKEALTVNNAQTQPQAMGTAQMPQQQGMGEGMPQQAQPQPQPQNENPLIANLPEDQKRLFYEIINR